MPDITKKSEPETKSLTVRADLHARLKAYCQVQRPKAKLGAIAEMIVEDFLNEQEAKEETATLERE